MARRSTSRRRVERRRAPYLAAEAVFGKGIREGDARLRVAQRGLHFGGVVADGRYDTEACDNDPSHVAIPSQSCRQPVRPPLPASTGRPQVGRLVDGLAVGLQPAIGDAEHQPSAHDALEVDAVFDLLDGWRDHALELHFAGRQRHALAGLAEPAEEEAGQLPHGIEAEAAGHDRVADEMAGEEPAGPA